MKFVVESENSLVNKIYEAISPFLKGGAVFGLEGDLGAGKTTLVQGLAKKMNIQGPVTSPTFSIIKRYSIEGSDLKLQHLDLYRFEKPLEADRMEIMEVLEDKKAISFVEWPERLEGLQKKMVNLIKIKQVDQNKREVEIVKLNH